MELYNAGDKTIDLSGWYFSKGISYTFPPRTSIAAGEYLIVTEDVSVRTISPITSVSSKYGTRASLIYGPFSGSLSNDGEKIELRSSSGIEIDQVDYKMRFPWPTVGDEIPALSYGDGHSIQLVKSEIDNDLGGSWRSAYPTPGAVNTAVYVSNLPPYIRQVKHTPKQPGSTEIVTVSAKVTAYDLVSSRLVIPEEAEEMALTLNGKRNRLKRHDFLDFAESMQIEAKYAESKIAELLALADKFADMIANSLLTVQLQERFLEIITQRLNRLAK